MITPPKTTLQQIAAAWQAQMRAAADKPWLFARLTRQWERLFRRFAHFYRRLLALPRPHKLALKRKLATTLAGAAFMPSVSLPPPMPPLPVTPVPTPLGGEPFFLPLVQRGIMPVPTCPPPLTGTN